MIPRLELVFFASSNSSCSIPSPRYTHHGPALRSLKRLMRAYHSKLILSSHVTLQKSFHTASLPNVSATRLHAQSDGFVAPAPRRPRAFAARRFFTPPRFHLLDSRRNIEKTDYHFNNGKKIIDRSKAGASQPAASSPPASASSSSSVVSLLSARLSRNYILAACPLLYSTTLSACVVKALWNRVTTSSAITEKELTKLAKETQVILRSSADNSNATVDDASWGTITFPCVKTLCYVLHRCGSSLSEAAFVQCLCELVASSSAEMEGSTVVMVQSLLAYWSSSPHRDAPSPTHVESVVRSLLDSASAVQLPVLLEALQVRAQNFTTPTVTSSSLTPTPARFPSCSTDPYKEQSLLPQCNSYAADRFRGAIRWHPRLSGTVVKLCLQRVVQLLAATIMTSGGNSDNNKRKGRSRRAVATSLAPVLRSRLQRCCLCHLPPLTDHRTLHDCAVLTMGALKGAAFVDLVAAYEYFVTEGLVSVPVALRFLTNCGMCAPHVMQRGVSLYVYIEALAAASATPPVSSRVTDFIVVPRAILAPLLHARSTLLESGRKLKEMEGGLVHVNAVLNALGYAADVRAFYASRLPQKTSRSLPKLRETPHSVMSFVHLRNVGAAVAALAELGASCPEGWVFAPPAVVECMEAVSRLVGEAGTPTQVDALYIALIDFHNGALFTSHYVELVLAGVCDRIRDLRSVMGKRQEPSLSQETQSKATPCEVLDRIIPVVRATLRYVGDDLNADMILELVETALHVTDYAVSLTAALMWAFRACMDLSLCLQELLFRVDASTHNVPFLHYYALCYARDFCGATVFDHLAALWHVDSDAIWFRAAHLSPSCQLWKCAACGRLNSDRHNYCLCSALRYSHVLCAACGYAQDERLRLCLSCGTTLLSTAALSGAIARKGWLCDDCGARNPAKQTLMCFRCGHPTGPRFRDAVDGITSNAIRGLKSFCDCHGANDAVATATSNNHGKTNGEEHSKDNAWRQRHNNRVYAAAVGVCCTCGKFKMDYAAHHSAVWVCTSCHQRRSTLERICPSCPQVECLPHAVRRESLEVARVCCHCKHEETNPFAVVCTRCGSSVAPLREAEGAKVTGAALSATTAESSSTNDTATAMSQVSPVVHWCFHCRHVQPWAEDGVGMLQYACCDSCGAPCEERGRCTLPSRACRQCGASLQGQFGGSAVCPYCAAYVAPPPQSIPHSRLAVATAGTGSASDARVWNPVTVLHTCEVLDECCAREARQAADGLGGDAVVTVPVSATSALTADPATDTSTTATAIVNSTFLQSRPSLEKTLTLLVHEWTSEVRSGLGAAAWLSMRVDVAVVLGRALNRLRPHLSTSLTARRISALLKLFLTHVDEQCGTAATGSRDTVVGLYNAKMHFLPEEVCHQCLNTHPHVLCPFCSDSGRWICEECGAANGNDNVGRYVCAGCLALRPVVQDLLVSTCWTCHYCYRANVQFERYCMHCGLERIHWSIALLPPIFLKDSSAEVTEEGNGKEPVSEEAEVRPPASPRDDEIPFAPAKCHLCGLVYIEARCPLCQNHTPDVADAKGTVCEVRAQYAYIQPLGTNRLQDRIFVDKTLLQANLLREGLEVHYIAELGARGRMQATFIQL